jgi:hypothetical protein
MSDFCLWSLALGAAPLVVGVLWDQVEWHCRQSARLRGNTARLVLNGIRTRAATTLDDDRLRLDSLDPRAGAQSHSLYVR